VSEPQLSISAEDGGVLRSLLDWLKHEDTLRGRVRTAQTPVRSGEMGGVLDVLMVALGSGGAGAASATSVSTWLSQPRRADVTLTVTAEDGRHIELDARHIRDPARLRRGAIQRDTLGQACAVMDVPGSFRVVLVRTSPDVFSAFLLLVLGKLIFSTVEPIVEFPFILAKTGNAGIAIFAFIFLIF
jgi:Effector Associated Constant Component 1